MEGLPPLKVVLSFTGVAHTPIIDTATHRIGVGLQSDLQHSR